MSAFILRVDAKENDVKIGIFTALFGDWPLSQVASHVADLGYEAVELPAWAGNPHLDLSGTGPG
jgi:sugar phosphate isomerase/epimerase